MILSDRYELISEIGKGGMSTVYLAKDKTLGSFWAVKRVENNKSVDLDSFKKEVELLSSLQHSDIPRIVDRVEIDNNYFVVMDFIDGTSLGKKVVAEGVILEDKVVEYAKNICDILTYLHTVKKNPIVYRDLKPDNIMLLQSGRVKLIDFGISMECERGKIQLNGNIGTKGFAAPEQYKSGSGIFDERTDIYSLGATLYYLSTGTVPSLPSQSIKSVRNINSSLSEGLDYIIAKCMEINPENRYDSAKELKEDLENIAILNTEYKRKVFKRLVSFFLAVIICFLSLVLTISGYKGIKYNKSQNYKAYMIKALDEKREGNYVEAVNSYRNAIKFKNDEIEVYTLLFDALLRSRELTSDEDDTYNRYFEDAIHEVNMYISDEKSPMYNNVTLMYEFVKNCLSNISGDKISYAKTAYNFIEYIVLTEDYQNGSINKEEIECYRIIAAKLSGGSVNYSEVQVALDKLIEISKNSSINERLKNYHIVLEMYSTYSTDFVNSYDKIDEIGKEVSSSLETIIATENFENIESYIGSLYIPICRLMITAVRKSSKNHMINDKNVENNKDKIEEIFLWFDYLETFNANISDDLLMYKANAYYDIFKLYDNPEYAYKIDEKVLVYLDTSIDLMTNISKNQNSNDIKNKIEEMENRKKYYEGGEYINE